jgi:hypothetical protein
MAMGSPDKQAVFDVFRYDPVPHPMWVQLVLAEFDAHRNDFRAAGPLRIREYNGIVVAGQPVVFHAHFSSRRPMWPGNSTLTVGKVVLVKDEVAYVFNYSETSETDASTDRILETVQFPPRTPGAIAVER